MDIKIHINNAVNKEESFNNTIENNLKLLFNKKDIFSYFIGNEYVFNTIIPINILSKSELNNFVMNLDPSFGNEVPDWLTGITTDDGIFLVYFGDYDLILLLHECIHFLSKQLKEKKNNERYLFLEESMSTYICSQMSTGKFNKIVEDYQNNNLRTIKSLLDSNDNYTFANNNGYYYAFFFMKFIKNIYEKSKIVTYIKDSKIFLKDIEKLEKEFRDYLISQIDFYTNKNHVHNEVNPKN